MKRTIYTDDPARNAIFEAELATASHAAQAKFWRVLDNGNMDGDELDFLRWAVEHPEAYAAPGAALWTDAEMIEILTDAAVIDKVTGRALGHWEVMRLDQRDMIRRALPQR